MATNLRMRAFWSSLGVHAVVLGVTLALPAGPLRRSAQPDDVEVVFHRPPPPVEIPRPAIPLPRGGAIPAGPKTAHVARPSPAAPAAPLAAAAPGFPEAVAEAPVAEPPRQQVGKSGILAFRDQIASVADDKNTLRLGTASQLRAAANASTSSPSAYLLNAVSDGSGGINAAALTRSVGGGGGGGGSMRGVAVGRATDSLASIGGGGGPHGRSSGGPADGLPGRGGPGPARTDEEIQIVFDRHKASFYRLYHQELRNDPALKGQIVLRLTIEPDGTVSMCTLQSTDMHAPELASEVVDRVRVINFGAKDGVAALTIVYPIDFLPAA